ncbi:MAG TPA: hypothetical protein PKI60_01420 [Oscillospiraceae bacterium]|nr:hypothetical protein [Oscillospiraceae bacterium]
MAIDVFIVVLIVSLVIAAWIYSVVFGYIEKERLKRFSKFLQINGREILSGATLEFEGVKYSAETELVQYQWCMSIFVMTFVRVTSFKIRGCDSGDAVISNLITALGGWWGIPWGPIRTIQCFVGNCNPNIESVSMLICENGYN